MDSMGIAASGMRVASLRLDAAASNVARLPVDAAQRWGVNTTADAHGGATGTVVAAPPDAAAPAGDLLQARAAALTFDANARMLKAGDDSLGCLLDVIA